MAYIVKERFLTLQGEGVNAGRVAVFCRFTGCNLWSGREGDRVQAQCNFCDTDFVGTDGVGGGRFEAAAALASAVAHTWGAERAHRLVVLTGGEPLLQVDEALINALHVEGFEVALETNGTQPIPAGLDWVCVSPKAGTECIVTVGDELKFIFPQPGLNPQQFEALNFKHFLLQPMDNAQQPQNTEAAICYCQQHPRWRLSIQTHKVLGLP
jgi:7-carboxy-7-deazaguanine synthase